jgi:hypothetical protein
MLDDELPGIEVIVVDDTGFEETTRSSSVWRGSTQARSGDRERRGGDQRPPGGRPRLFNARTVTARAVLPL